MTSVDLLISARWILPIVPANQIFENHSVAVTAGRISAILPSDIAKQQLQAKQHIHLPEHVLMPGLINAHTHSPMTLFRGLADDLPLMDWLQKHMWPAEATILNPSAIADGTQLALLEMIRTGTTCFVDNYFFHDTIAEVSAHAGMRCCASTIIMQIPTTWANNETEYLHKAQASLKRNAHHPLIHWAISPHSPYAVSDKALVECQALAEQFNLPLLIHLHESTAEIQQALESHQQRPIAHLQQLGLLTPRLVAAHMVHVAEEDLELIIPAKINVVHCPQSNLKLGNGFAPIDIMLKHGLNVAIGTDGAGSNNNLDMFSELRCTALLTKGERQDPTALPAMTALTMATLNGAKALGLADDIGSLEVTKIADMIAINMNHYATQPMYNPISHLVYAINSLQVSDVWVAGKQLLQNGEFVTLDSKKIVQQAQRWVEKARPFSS